MLNQQEVRDPADKTDGFLKGAIRAAEQVADVGFRVERVKKTVTNAIDDTVSDAKRMVKRSVYAAEDLVDDTAHLIKKEPLKSVAVMFSVGLGVGLVAGWLVGHRTKAC